MKIVALSDTHFAESSPLPRRRGELADILLQRAVHRINRWIRPDVVVVLGDLVNDGHGPRAIEYLQQLRSILDTLTCPVIVLPGNHDGDVAAFSTVFPMTQSRDVQGVRFLSFLDPEEPGYNARRTSAELPRMAAARHGYSGPIVALQHCALYPPKMSECPYNYVNADEVLATMRAQGVSLAISGHYHQGVDIIRHDGGACIITPALCEPPFAFLEITMNGDTVRSVTRHQLAMPPEFGLVDCHVHTPFAYCGEDMDFQKSIQLAEAFNLGGLFFTEHSGHLYFDAETYHRCAFLNEGTTYQQGVQNRFSRYLADAMPYCPPARLGIEADCDYHGRPVLRADDRQDLQLLVGSVHALPELQKPQPDMTRAADEYLAEVSTFVTSGIHVLAHAFRVFRRAGVRTPEELFHPIVQLLREHGVAAEVNFHTNEPSPEFISMCINAGVKLTFGSDAHALYEIGEFTPQLALLRECGLAGDPTELLADFAYGTCAVR